LEQRIRQHKNKIYKDSFSAKYNLQHLVRFQAFPTITEAITYEKKIKGRTRAKKLALIEQLNPEWKDLLKMT
jgi:putative endonuclease